MKDVPTFKYNQKGKDKEDITRKWWMSEKARAHETIWPLVNFIRQSQSTRHLSNSRFFRMYSNESLDNLAASRHLNNLSSFFGESSKLTLNVVKSCIDTARSKIAKEKPRPLFLTENGNWHLQQKAKKLSQFMGGLFDQMGSPNGLVRESLYTIGSEVFLDACITGTGAAKMFIKNNKIVVERCMSDEIIVDQFEGLYRTPRSMHQIKYVDRDVLFDTYPEAKYRKIIEEARKASTGIESNSQDMIPVIESYHLPSGKDAKDGRRIISVESGVLHHTEWDKSYFPFLIQRWGLRPAGYYGLGLAEELQGIQRELNQTLMNIQTGLRRVAVPRVYAHIADHTPKKRMTNEIGEVYYYRQQPPTFNTAQAFNAETYNHVDRLWAKAFETTGISQLSSTAAKPAGLNSGVAIRNYQDIESERFSTVHTMYENFYTPQATYMALDLLDTLLEAGHDITVQSQDGMTFRPIKYSEVRIPQDSFTVRAYPTAFLPSEPSGKFAKAMEGVEAGFWDIDEARDLMDFPDLKKAIRVKSAKRNAVYSYVETLIDTGEYQPIEPYQDIPMTKDMLQSYYLEGRTSGMPEDRMDLLRRIMEEIRVKEETAAKLAQEQAMEQQAEMAEQQMQQQAAMSQAQQPPAQEMLAPPQLDGAIEPEIMEQ